MIFGRNIRFNPDTIRNAVHQKARDRTLNKARFKSRRFLPFRLLVIASVFFIAPFFASAQTETFRARLSPMPTTPQTVNEITGGGEVILTLIGNTLTVEGSFEGMSSTAMAAHVHNSPPARLGPVVHTLKFTDAAAGEITAQLQLSDDQVADLKANNFYIQVHSMNNPSGELRGWVFLSSHFQ
jgi:hypothetical protein|tara:strand:+ start:650 stop:1198 length:549 start_codon:yes stop_codon:yes gene_type:complete